MTGDVIIDDRLFDTAESTGSGPHRVSPIMINDNVVDVLVQPGKAVGEPASVSFLPATQFVTMDAQVETVAADQAADLKVQGIGSRRFTVRGKIPAGHHRLVLIHEVDDPASFARALFIEALRHAMYGSTPASSVSTRRPAWPPGLRSRDCPRSRSTLRLPFASSSRSSSRSVTTCTPARCPCCWRPGTASEPSRPVCEGRVKCSRTWESSRRPSRLGEEPAARGPTWSRRAPRSRCSRPWPPARTFPPTRPRCRFSAAMARWRAQSPGEPGPRPRACQDGDVLGGQ